MSNVIVGQPLGEFINPNLYEINTSVSVKEVQLINIGDQVVISSNDFNSKITGSVSRIGNHINELTQSVDVFILIDDNQVKDGMYVTGEILCEKIENIVKIDRSKLLINNQVYTITNDTLRLKPVEVVVFQDDSAIVRGLDDNNCIVDEYRNYFYDSMPIN